jgi:hypothetical protein
MLHLLVPHPLGNNNRFVKLSVCSSRPGNNLILLLCMEFFRMVDKVLRILRFLTFS